MGTNYYWKSGKGACEKCGHCDNENIHIGKSSSGWCFGLHVYPENGICNLADWIERLSEPGAIITDEYGHPVSSNQMLLNIVSRWRPPGSTSVGFDYERNMAEPGPCGMIRRAISANHCVGHGEGPWDYIVGDFS